MSETSMITKIQERDILRVVYSTPGTVIIDS